MFFLGIETFSIFFFFKRSYKHNMRLSNDGHFYGILIFDFYHFSRKCRIYCVTQIKVYCILWLSAGVVSPMKLSLRSLFKSKWDEVSMIS